LRDLHKWFGSTHAVDGVSLNVAAGEVVGLIGTNGAGKSSLIKVLAGVHEPSSGTVEIDGQPVRLGDPLQASRLGIQTVHQNIDHGIVPGMSVAENLALDSLADGTIPLWASPRSISRKADAIAQRMQLSLDLAAPVEDLSPSERQQLIIARSLGRDPRLLILDEPTSTLSEAEVTILFGIIRRLSASGVAVMFVSHYLHEIESICDRVAVLRDGQLVGVFEQPLNRSQMVEAMLGELIAAEDTSGERDLGEAVLEVDGLRAWPGGDQVHLQLRRGEVVGLTGLIGAGKTEIVEQIFGARPIVDGHMRLRGRPFVPHGPSEAVKSGIGMVPEERGRQAIIPDWSVRENVTIPFLRRYSGIAGLLSLRRERDSTEAIGRRMSLVYGGPDAPIDSLSGGNQQKVVVGRWLQVQSDLLILDEPFRGIDIGTRADISAELRAISRRQAVLVVSSDPEEILEVADRVVVLASGKVVGEVKGSAISTKLLAEMMAGGSS
jgi:simple sugar transport system ATP-binding protein